MKKLLSLFLTVCILAVSLVIPSVNAVERNDLEQTGATDYGLCDNLQQGQILQCWNWSYNAIKDNMKTIAEQGFSAIQTSPIQQAKESTSGRSVSDGWWVYYQPAYFRIDNTGNSALGNKSEFIAMCNEAHKYGVKVVVDAVLNHMGNNGAKNTVSSAVDPDIKNDSSCWHDVSRNTTNYNNRYDITQYCMDGLPDLNTANKKVQNKAIAFLKECVDCGVDGFRFDGAKHIEFPEDPSNCRSDFWSNVLNTTTSYAKSKGKTMYYYGEVLNETGGLSISNMTKYMTVSANNASSDIRNKVCQSNAGGASRTDYSYMDGNNPSADKALLWNESHDEYVNGSDSVSTANINKAWAIMGSRSKSSAMYFARPASKNQKIGIGSKTACSNPEVAAVNQFKNFFAGQSENLSASGSIVYNVRGTGGVVIVNCSGTSTSVSLASKGMANGTYTDQVSGNTFTVSGGKISGQVGGTGIAVVYNAVVSPKAIISQRGGNFKTDTLTLTLSLANATSGTYKIDNAAAKTFTGNTSITIGSGVAYDKTITVTLTATDGKETTTETFTFVKVDPSKVSTISYDNSSSNWSNVYFYIYDESSSSVKEVAKWPGVQAVNKNGNVYSMDVPEGYENGLVIFNNGGSNQVPAQNEKGFPLSSTSKIYRNGQWLDDVIITPTEPVTEPVTSSPDDPIQGTYKYGDINADGSIGIVDATLVQKFCAKTITFDDFKNKAADVDGDGHVSINDATLIQKYVCKMINSFNAGETFTFGQVNPTEQPTQEPTESDDYVVYFKNTQSWSSVYAYAWNSTTGDENRGWPGIEMKSEGNNIYSIVLNGDYSNIIFTNGSTQTDDLDLCGKGMIYDYSTGSWSKKN